MILKGHMNFHETPWKDFKSLSDETILQYPVKLFNAMIYMNTNTVFSGEIEIFTQIRSDIHLLLNIDNLENILNLFGAFGLIYSRKLKSHPIYINWSIQIDVKSLKKTLITFFCYCYVVFF